MSKHDVEAVQYSLGRPSQRTGLGGYSMKTTVVVAIGFFGYLLAHLAGQAIFGFLVVLPVTALVTAMVTVQWAGRSLATTLRMIVQDSGRKRAGEHIYLSGELSRVPGGHHRLPGVLSRTKVLRGTDVDHQPFAAIVDGPARLATVMLDCQLTGQTPMTQEERNIKTSEWSRWLSMMSFSGDIDSVATVVSTRPGTGQLVAKEVDSIVAEGVPPIAEQIMREAGSTLATGVPEILSHIAITVRFDGESLADEAFMDQLATRVPGWYQQLAWAGIIASPMDEEEIVARVHAFYNPAAEADLETLEVGGQPHGVSWADAGPSVARTTPSNYYHDGCISVSWEMKDAPRSTFEDTLLTGLMAPHARAIRKRVAVVYRPYEAGQGVYKVESEYRDAKSASNSSKKITPADTGLRLEHTEAARRAQARGAQLGRYSLFVTATVDDLATRDRVVHEVEQLGSGASVRLQVMNRQQDTGFVISCGLGQVPWKKETTDLSHTALGM
ncbi:hypothetical protein CATRI_13540 (plasmid) [Corynebacterium atrinae]|uniref:SCO6880 family protein n=1 Tax=Actinomycetes TaxID=1760 RepID=UPI0025B3BCD1|nr:SCO6880 family protein [Corynebacterium atrinae]WJY64752.1 hypothetical protein CATRI_13540 [Corynebacterium atrinae]